MSDLDRVIEAWDQADPAAIHPSRGVSEAAYRESGQAQAELLATVLPAGCRVVDFGCGDGRVAVPLRALGYDVVGADSSDRMLDRLRKSDAKIETVRSNGVDLAGELGKKVDAVVCLAVLIHHTYASATEIVAGLRAAVRVNGLLVLDWPVSDDPVEGSTWISVTTWTRAMQDDVCRQVGLKRLDSDLPWPVFRAVKAG
ncbi:class I SAM-dependent methyltransferase [Streptomyces sp. NPDC090054]|uniref:class I SAM-dependent methyltransferase n=1 Tax=Streptomyces sp. NPDC090054 TaxID=3365933 RepID=UPI0037F7EB6D